MAASGLHGSVSAPKWGNKSSLQKKDSEHHSCVTDSSSHQLLFSGDRGTVRDRGLRQALPPLLPAPQSLWLVGLAWGLSRLMSYNTCGSEC